MTGNVTPAVRLREMSRAASPAPWRALLYKTGHDFEPPTVIEPNINCGNGYDGEIKADDCRLIVALRNDAEKYADLVEAAGALVALYDAPWHSQPDMEGAQHDAVDALRAALAALGGGA